MIVVWYPLAVVLVLAVRWTVRHVTTPRVFRRDPGPDACDPPDCRPHWPSPVVLVEHAPVPDGPIPDCPGDAGRYPSGFT